MNHALIAPIGYRNTCLFQALCVGFRLVVEQLVLA